MTDQTEIAAGQFWRHKKRGKVYEIIHIKGRMQCSSNPAIESWLEHLPLVVYINVADHDDCGVRPLAEFTDGRFENVLNTKWCMKHTNRFVTIVDTSECIRHESVLSGKNWYLGYAEFFDRYERVQE